MKKPVYTIQTKLINDKLYLCGYQFIGETDESQPAPSGSDIFIGEMPRDLYDDNLQPLYVIDSGSLMKSPLPTPEKVVLRREVVKLNAFLADTDWYVVRSLDNGKPVPEDIANERERARTRIDEIKSLLNHLP
jgi:hypothetical protein